MRHRPQLSTLPCRAVLGLALGIGAVAGGRAAAADLTLATSDGLSLTLDDATGRVTRVRIDGQSPTNLSVYGGLYVRDRANLLSATPGAANLLPNASFEVDSEPDGIPDGWIFDDGWLGGATFSLDANAFSGSLGATIHNFAGGLLRTTVLVQPGQRYLLQAMVKGSAHSQIAVYWIDSSDVGLFWENGASLGPQADWKAVHFVATAPANAAYAYVYFMNVSNGTNTYDVARMYEAPPEAFSPVAGTLTPLPSGARQVSSLAALGLDVQADYITRPDRIEIEVLIRNTRGGDRALEAGFMLPVVARRVWDTPYQSRDIVAEFSAQAYRYNFCGSRWTDGYCASERSVFPFAAVSLGADLGLALGYDVERGPQDAQFFYSTYTNESFTAEVRLGIAPEPLRFAGETRFRLLLYRVAGSDAFRSALERYYALSGDVFENRMSVVGGWIPWRQPRTIPGAADFGIGVHTYHDSVADDDADGILSLAYLPSFDYWLDLGDFQSRPSLGDARARLQFLASDPTADPAKVPAARAAVVSGCTDAASAPIIDIYQASWMPGSGWAGVTAVNPDPEVVDPGGRGWASVFDRSQADLDAAFAGASSSGAVLDGVFLDWFRSWNDGVWNLRRDHFRTADTPLSFDPVSLRPALAEGFAHWEAARELRRQMRARGLVTMARDIATPSFWATSVLDAMGQELDWTNGVSHGDLAFYRAVAGRKPYLLLLNADYASYDVEQALGVALLYGFFLAPHWDTGAGGYYWDQPGLPDRDRALFQRYVPLWRLQTAAGWQPRRHAVTSDADLVLAERFGSPASGTLLYSLLNRGASAVVNPLAIDLAALGVAPASVRRVIDLVEGRVVDASLAGSTLTIAEGVDPGAARLYQLRLASGSAPIVLRAVKRGADVELLWTGGSPVGGSYAVLLSAEADLGSAAVRLAPGNDHRDLGAVAAPSTRFYGVE